MYLLLSINQYPIGIPIIITIVVIISWTVEQYSRIGCRGYFLCQIPRLWSYYYIIYVQAGKYWLSTTREVLSIRLLRCWEYTIALLSLPATVVCYQLTYKDKVIFHLTVTWCYRLHSSIRVLILLWRGKPSSIWDYKYTVYIFDVINLVMVNRMYERVHLIQSVCPHFRVIWKCFHQLKYDGRIQFKIWWMIFKVLK